MINSIDHFLKYTELAVLPFHSQNTKYNEKLKRTIAIVYREIT